MSVKRRLPAISYVRLESFSIYQERPIVEIEIRDGVFCLAGANGLGKSSFLAAVNFCLTGIVVHPERGSFSSMRKFYHDSLSYSRTFFDGRISELDRDSAEVTVHFTVGGHKYELTRNLFEPQSLRDLVVVDGAGQVLNQDTDDDDVRHQDYARLLVEDCRLSKFEQFVFLQHFLLTFDERRHLLFWDEQVMTPLLYLAFGIDADDARRADELTHAVNRAESRRRNAQWQATSARRKMKELGGDAVDESLLDGLLEQHQALSEAVDQATEELTGLQRGAADARLDHANASAEYQSLKHQYDHLFTRRLRSRSAPRLHPAVAESLKTERCSVCGTQGHHVVTKIEESLDANACPLCASSFTPTSEADSSIDNLREVDSELAQAGERVKAAQVRRDRFDKEVDAALQVYNEKVQQLESFDNDNEKTLPSLSSGLVGLLEQRRVAESERMHAVERRDEWARKRDTARRELEPLQKALRVAYEEAEVDFVPNFRDLARQFIGLDLDVFLDKADRTRFILGLEVQGTRRRTTTTLSESQRFFLDIALRMALVQQMTDAEAPSTVYIDTPEGSLDIAYEAKAGAMFGKFVFSGQNIMMTANINANQLLRRLAEVCRSEHMQMLRMTDWATLSEVQASEEALFDEAYSAVESILKSDGATERSVPA